MSGFVGSDWKTFVPPDEEICCDALGETKSLGRSLAAHVLTNLANTDVWYMVRRRASDACIETSIACHAFRATGITDYLTNGGRQEENPAETKLAFDRE